VSPSVAPERVDSSAGSATVSGPAPAFRPATAPVGSAVVRKGESVSGEVPEIEFVRPLPGFATLTRYVLVRLDGGEATDPEATMYELRNIEQPEVRFLVVVPTVFFPDYGFDLDEAWCAELGLESPEDALVLVLLTIGDDAASTTANLLAPVVINARTRTAAQVILSGTDWPVRAAVV
jgi:flagellar assembly factor FliW